MNNTIALESLVMDLKRVSLGYHRGSLSMAKRFSMEALKRKKEINENEVKPYIKKLLQKLDVILAGDDYAKIADETLMVSTLFQNYTQTNNV